MHRGGIGLGFRNFVVYAAIVLTISLAGVEGLLRAVLPAQNADRALLSPEALRLYLFK
jgi:hypothetical protein